MNYSHYSKKLLAVCVAVMLAVMSCLVFINVILRYGFNSGFTMTEELSRFLFIWVIFLGAVLAFSEDAHVKVTVFSAKLSAKGQRLLHIATDAIMLACCCLMIIGSWRQMVINWQNLSPIAGIPIGISFLAGVLMSLSIGVLLCFRLRLNLTALLKGEKV